MKFYTYSIVKVERRLKMGSIESTQARSQLEFKVRAWLKLKFFRVVPPPGTSKDSNNSSLEWEMLSSNITHAVLYLKDI